MCVNTQLVLHASLNCVPQVNVVLKQSRITESPEQTDRGLNPHFVSYLLSVFVQSPIKKQHLAGLQLMVLGKHELPFPE